jgi:hypothetical protein
MKLRSILLTCPTVSNTNLTEKLVKDKKIHEARDFNFTYRYIDDVLSINNSRFAEFLPLIYPPELEVKASKGDKYVIDEELQHTDHLFLGVACFTFSNFV